MPFGRTHNAAAQPGAPGYSGQDTGYVNNTTATGPMGTGGGPAMQPAVRDTTGTMGHHAGSGNQQDAYQQGGGYQHGMTNFPPHSGTGTTMNDPYANTVANNDVTPVNHFSSGQKSGHSSSTVGKIERVIGTITCNQTLKAKGIEKEREAEVVGRQRAEITEAERLEHEAMLRRERAVQHGADPSNRALGGAAQAQEFGGNFGNSSSAGTGPGAGNSSIPMARGGVM